MTDKIFEKQLNKMSGQLRELAEPNENWVQDTRNFLMSQIRSERVMNENIKIPFWLRMADILVPQNLVLKPVLIFSLVLGLFLISSFATVNASKNTLPGNPLYNVKISAEKVRYVLSVSQEQKAKTSLEIARKRAQEFKTLAVSLDQGDGEKQSSAKRVSIQLKSELDNVKNRLVKIDEEEEDNSKVVAMAKEIDKTLSQIESEMVATDQIDEKLKDDLKEVLAQTQAVKLAALAILDAGDEKQEAGGERLEAGDESLETGGGMQEASSTSDEIIITTPQVISTSTATSASVQTEDEIEWQLDSEKSEVVEEEFEVRIY